MNWWHCNNRIYSIIWKTIILFCIASVNGWGSGIPEFVFIAGPKNNNIVTNGAEITFEHNNAENNQDDFKGYIIYYKFYENDNDVNDAEWITDWRTITRLPITLGPQRLQDRNYRPIILCPNDVDTSCRNQIVIPSNLKGTNLKITINFDTERGTIQLGLSGIETPIYRSTRVNHTDVNREKPFYYEAEDFEPTDKDIENILDIETIKSDDIPISITFYVLGYGISSTDFQILYSSPVFLCTATIGSLNTNCVPPN